MRRTMVPLLLATLAGVASPALAQEAARACLTRKTRIDEQKKTTSTDVAVSNVGDRYQIANKTTKYGACKLDIQFDNGQALTSTVRFGPRQTLTAKFVRDGNARCWVQDVPPCMGVLW